MPVPRPRHHKGQYLHFLLILPQPTSYVLLPSYIYLPGNDDCSGEDKRLRILRNCPRKIIVGVAGCPSRRACPGCGMLIEHERDCKHMRCRCGKEFCFICLKPKESSGWTCGSYNTACKVAAVQTRIPGEN